MPMAAGPTSPTDLAAPVFPMLNSTPVLMADYAVSKDAYLAWFRSEFAAANAIIDALCSHLAQLDGGTGSEYKAVFAAVHRRRLNWIPVLQMQKFHSIADVAMELRKVTEKKAEEKRGECENENEKKCREEVSKEACVDEEKIGEEVTGGDRNDSGCGGGGNGDEAVEEEESPDSDITDSGSQEMHPPSDHIDICSNHEDCNVRPDHIKLTKGFSAKEQVKGHMVNVVKGLKLYEDVFTHTELSKLTEFANELRVAGQNGELSGDTFILFNKQMKGNKREMIQFGIPIFGHIKEEAESSAQKGCIEPIPSLLCSVIDHLIKWNLIPEDKKPNGCIINFFDEDEYSQPFLKPPHLEQPICSLLLSESTMAFGRTLVSDNDGNYRGPLMLSLKEGSLVVMRGNSADMARHAMRACPNKRVGITFFRVRPNTIQNLSPPTSPMAGEMTLWQPGTPGPYAMRNGAVNGFEMMDVVPTWGVHPTVVMLAPMQTTCMSPKRMPCDGTGVFLPWTVSSRKHARHLPPRAQRARILKVPTAVETQGADSASETAIPVDGKSA